MSLQRPILDISMEATAQLPYGTLVEIDSTGRAIVASSNSQKCVGVVVGNNGASAPFQCTVRVQGIAQILSDGSATITAGQPIFPSTTTTGRCKPLALSDGANVRQCIGLALNASVVAATAALLVDVLLMPSWVSNAT